MPQWLSGLVSSFKAATPSQQAYMVVAAVAALFLLPRALILAFVGLERLFVGLLLELEELIVLLTLKTLAAVSGGSSSSSSRAEASVACSAPGIPVGITAAGCCCAAALR